MQPVLQRAALFQRELFILQIYYWRYNELLNSLPRSLAISRPRRHLPAPSAMRAILFLSLLSK